MTPEVQAKLKSVAARYDELMRLVSDAAVQADPPTYRAHAKALADLQELMDCYREFTRVEQDAAEAAEMAEAGDSDMRALAAELEAQAQALELDIQRLLVPKDPNDDRNVVLEIRAGAGGDEAA